jgi:hypothetical protein
MGTGVASLAGLKHTPPSRFLVTVRRMKKRYAEDQAAKLGAL